MRDFRRLEAWQVADDLAVSVYQATSKFPREELYGLTAQLRRAAASVPSNVAEGTGRSGRPDYARFLDMARGSLMELRYQLHLAHRLGYLDADGYQTLESHVVKCLEVLSGLLRSVKGR